METGKNIYIMTKDKILSTVSEFYKVDLFQKTRKREVSFPRMVAISMLHLFTNMTLEEISKEFGVADHARVVYSKKTVWALCKVDPELRKEVITIETMLDA
jgi:chromosomal replication initiator protein